MHIELAATAFGSLLWVAMLFAAIKLAAAHLCDKVVLPAHIWPAAAGFVTFISWRDPQASPAAYVCVALAVAGYIDARTGYLPDALTLPAVLMGLGSAALRDRMHDAFLAVFEGAGVFGACYIVSRGRAIGLGDVKALYAVGAVFGPWRTACVVLGAALGTLLLSLLRGELKRGAALPFGPQLAASATLTLLSIGA